MVHHFESGAILSRPLYPAQDRSHPPTLPRSPCCRGSPPIGHLVDISIFRISLPVSHACVQVILILLPNGAKAPAKCILSVKRYVCIGKNSIRRVQYHPWFQASTGDLKTYPPRIRRDCCTLRKMQIWSCPSPASVPSMASCGCFCQV